ncbi:hypothetical protein YC2023_048842 [Brassica napus]
MREQMKRETRVNSPKSILWACDEEKKGKPHEKEKAKKSAVAGDRTRVTRVTGGNTYHYTTTTLVFGMARAIALQNRVNEE